MTQEDFNTFLGLIGVLLALSLGLTAVLVATAFAGGLLLGHAWQRARGPD